MTLLDERELAESGPPEAVRLPLDLVDANARNPRGSLPEVDALADNIKAFGLLQPITVRRAGDRYEILGGHRRRAAFQLLREREPHEVQWRTIPAVVRNATDEQANLMLISGQVQISAWKPREEAAALEQLVLGGMNLRQVGEALNRTEGWASKRLRVYADSVLSGYVQSGKLGASIAEVFIAVKDPAERRDLADRAVAETWTQPRAKAELRKISLDSTLRDVAKRAAELAEILGSIDAARLPIGATRDLWVLHGRIEVLARGGAPKMPTIEQAERAAGVKQTDRPRPRGQKRKPGYKPRV